MSELSVGIRSGQLREEPSFLGRVVRVLDYGDRVELLMSESGWKRVRSGSQEGWMHEAALVEQRIVLNPGAEDVERAASDSELALAGKGFSASVEREYRQRHRNIDFAAVDRMESRSTDQAALARFVREGELNRT